MVVMETAAPLIREGSASGSITFQMICQLEEPMAWAASTTPDSTSSSEDSTIRAT